MGFSILERIVGIETEALAAGRAVGGEVSVSSNGSLALRPELLAGVPEDLAVSVSSNGSLALRPGAVWVIERSYT